MQEETSPVVDPERIKDYKKDLVSSVVIFGIGVFSMVNGGLMPVAQLTGSPDLWYVAPGVFPILTGAVLALLATILFVRAMLNGGLLRREDMQAIGRYFATKEFMKLAAAIGFIAIYIFVLIGRLPYYLASFVYLAGSMAAFRKTGYAWWKITVICVLAVAAITYGFGTLARIPLP